MEREDGCSIRRMESNGYGLMDANGDEFLLLPILCVGVVMNGV